MRNLLITGAAVMLSAVTLPAAAQAVIAPANRESAQSGGQAERSATGQQPRARDPNRRICVSDRLSDSRMRRRICRTQAEWESLQANDNDGLGR